MNKRRRFKAKRNRLFRNRRRIIDDRVKCLKGQGLQLFFDLDIAQLSESYNRMKWDRQ